MWICELLFGISFLLLSGIAAYSDIRAGIIRNKMLLIFLSAAAILNAVYYYFFTRDILLEALINQVIILGISFYLFYSHSFAGGDCKLAIVLSLLYPGRFYFVYHTTNITLFFSIGLALVAGYIYLLITAVAGLTKGKSRITIAQIKQHLLSFGKAFLRSTIYLSCFNMIVTLVCRSLSMDLNIWILRITCIAIAIGIGKLPQLRKWYILLAVGAIDIFLSTYLRALPLSLDIHSYVLVVVLLLCQMAIKSSLYQTIEVGALRKGMILSINSSIFMQGTRFQNMPSVSTEDLRSRLTGDEVNSIQRWAKSRKVSSVEVVKKIPFAVFLSLGYLLYFLLWSVTQ